MVICYTGKKPKKIREKKYFYAVVTIASGNTKPKLSVRELILVGRTSRGGPGMPCCLAVGPFAVSICRVNTEAATLHGVTTRKTST
jgi:hypothetical protein